VTERASAADVELRRQIDAMHDAAEARLTAVRPRMIAVEGGEPMVWTEHDEPEQEGATGGRIQ
jgi:hypothetical protein